MTSNSNLSRNPTALCTSWGCHERFETLLPLLHPCSSPSRRNAPGAGSTRRHTRAARKGSTRRRSREVEKRVNDAISSSCDFASAHSRGDCGRGHDPYPSAGRNRDNKLLSSSAKARARRSGLLDRPFDSGVGGIHRVYRPLNRDWCLGFLARSLWRIFGTCTLLLSLSRQLYDVGFWRFSHDACVENVGTARSC
jgi:hypothetical protein